MSFQKDNLHGKYVETIIFQLPSKKISSQGHSMIALTHILFQVHTYYYVTLGCVDTAIHANGHRLCLYLFCLCNLLTYFGMLLEGCYLLITYYF